MNNELAKSYKKQYYVGLGLVLLQWGLFIFSRHRNNGSSDFFLEDEGGTFFLTYFISIFYHIVTLFKYRTFLNFKKIPMVHFIILLTMLTISAFTLDLSINLFATMSDWASIYLILFYVVFLSVGFIDKIPKLLRLPIFFILGLGAVITLYFSIYLFPTYHIAFIAAFVMGMSLHLIVPLLVFIFLLILVAKYKTNLQEKLSFGLGIVCPMLVIAVFLYQWHGVDKSIHKSKASSITRPDNTLPEWVLMCQEVATDPLSTKIIEGKLVYDTFSRIWRRGVDNNSFDESRRHDPLVNIGLFFHDDIDLDYTTRIKILKSQHNARHKAQRKLWSGRDLIVSEVFNNIKVYPEYRLAYTEKVIEIKNTNRWRRNSQEAAFSFHLPEGSVVSSLSLWINGKEEKSRLTTKEKADNAYREIVGVKHRDPALLHWQEGNTVTVTVFPCTPAENRRFKIGVSTPLEKKGDKLILKNVYFEGPNANKAFETSHIVFESEHEVKGVNLPSSFDNVSPNKYLYSGNYNLYWEVSCDAVPLSEQVFTFHGHSYAVKELSKEKASSDIKQIYLDLNKSWTAKEYYSLLDAKPNISFFAYKDRFIKINEENKKEVFEELTHKNFSLFPFHYIKDIDHSLVVSKSTALSPNLDDLKKSVFKENLMNSFKDRESNIKLYDIGEQLSPYLKSLKELQCFHYDVGDISKLNNLLQKNEYVMANKNPNQVDIDIAHLSICKKETVGTSKAPDHLFRLFTYGGIMKKIGRNYFDKDKLALGELSEMANEAYIVSPTSSLVVLESQKDYDDYDIKKNKNSLGNASMNSSGAAPEPSDYLLIALLLICLFVLYRKKKANAFVKHF